MANLRCMEQSRERGRAHSSEEILGRQQTAHLHSVKMYVVWSESNPSFLPVKNHERFAAS